MSTFKHFQKYNKILSNVHKIGGTHLQCVNTHYAKFEYKEMKTVEVADYTQITQCKHSKGGVHIIMSTFKHFQKYNKILSNMHKIGGTHLQCVNNHYAKFEYNGMKTVGDTKYTNQTPPKHSGWKNV